MIEEVKKILYSAETVEITESGNTFHSASLSIIQVKGLAEQICQLFLEWLNKHGTKQQVELWVKEREK